VPEAFYLRWPCCFLQVEALNAVIPPACSTNTRVPFGHEKSKRLGLPYGKSQNKPCCKKLAPTLEASEHAPRLLCAGEILTPKASF